MKKTNVAFYATVIRPYNSWSDKLLATECKSIQTAVTDNPDFPSPDPDMVVYGAAVDAFIAQLAKASTRDVNAVAAKNSRRSELIALSIRLGNSAEFTADGNLEMLLGTGLPLRKQPATVVLGTPVNLRITNGINAGTLIAKVDGMPGCRTFNFEFTQDPPTEATWEKLSRSTSRCLIEGLESGKRYWIKVAVVGGNEQTVWGEPMLSPFVQ